MLLSGHCSLLVYLENKYVPTSSNNMIVCMVPSSSPHMSVVELFSAR